MTLRRFYVYILANERNTVLYTGVTGDLLQRATQHRENQVPGFTSRYNVSKLVYFKEFGDAITTIEREKQLKAGSRQKKLDLVNTTNPTWADLYPGLLVPE